mmetsp:Transcript_89423/g.255361  ORF Transcript_89423/g.255361 Transcript_89423/m.255361 type:complete len:333 (+) Transcript_89423:516-1514(+)
MMAAANAAAPPLPIPLCTRVRLTSLPLPPFFGLRALARYSAPCTPRCAKLRSRAVRLGSQFGSLRPTTSPLMLSGRSLAPTSPRSEILGKSGPPHFLMNVAEFNGFFATFFFFSTGRWLLWSKSSFSVSLSELRSGRRSTLSLNDLTSCSPTPGAEAISAFDDMSNFWRVWHLGSAVQRPMRQRGPMAFRERLSSANGTINILDSCRLHISSIMLLERLSLMPGAPLVPFGGPTRFSCRVIRSISSRPRLSKLRSREPIARIAAEIGAVGGCVTSSQCDRRCGAGPCALCWPGTPCPSTPAKLSYLARHALVSSAASDSRSCMSARSFSTRP